MNDRLLRELGDLARSETRTEEARFGDRWDRLAADTLTAEEEAELRALAESSPEDREAYEAFRPLGADFQARVVSAIHSEGAERAGPAAPPPPAPQEPPPRVLPFRRVVRRAEVWVGLAAAMAAGVFFLIRTPASPLTSGYVADLSGGFKASRGSETAPLDEKQVFAPGSPFTLEIKPKEPLEHPGKVRPGAFLSSIAGREDLTPVELKGQIEAGETGSVRLSATMGTDIQVKPGDWILWMVVSRSSLPGAREVQARLRANQPREASWQTLCDGLRQEERPPSSSPWQVACVAFRAEGQPAP